MAEESEKQGPYSYRNWVAHDRGDPLYSQSEIPIYSDAHIVGEVREGLGPYALRNGLPQSPMDPAVVLVSGGHLDPRIMAPMNKTDTDSFTGSWSGDEIAALCALAFGARMMAGEATRWRYPSQDLWHVHGDGRRPAFLARRVGRGTVLPRVVDTTTLNATLLKTFPLVSGETATALVRAARSYRDGLWIAETEPALAWLLFVSALEVAAVQVHIDRTRPEEILRASKPALVARLEGVAAGLAGEVADALKLELRATARFLDFMEAYAPAPPEVRPMPPLQLDWSASNLRRCLKKVYDHRSLALHEAIPFPPPMCDAPWRAGPPGTVAAEVTMGLASSTIGGVWKQEDAPFQLQTFEYLTRGALLNWWRSLAPEGQAAPEALER